MNLDSIKTGIKRFFSNPNTLTFLLVIVLIVIIYVVYSFMIKRAVAPVEIPYCTKKALSQTEITDDYIANVKISGGFVTANGSTLVQNKRNVKNRYVAPGYFIPENSFFYTDALADSTIQEKTIASDLPNDYSIFYLPVDFHTTYGCSIMSGNTIDLYIKAEGEERGTVMFEPFIESIQVLGVYNKEGLDVFTEALDTTAKPTVMVFGVPIGYMELLNVATQMKNSIEILPIPRNSNYSENPKPPVMNDAVSAWLEAKRSTLGIETEA